MAEVRAPFKTMWIEFLDEKGGVVGCLQEDFGYEIGFQFFKEGEFLDRAVVIHRESKAHWIPLAGKEELFLPRHSLETFGISRYSFNGDDPYLKLLRSTDVMLKQMYSSEIGGVNEDFNPARFVRFVAMLMITLNYPWVTHEKVGVLRGGKGKNPRIVPHDSYYRCRIELPKDSIDMREPAEPRDEFYGKRLHQVRGHWRVLRNDDGSFRKRTWIGQHTRGDSKLGVVLKDYQLTADEKYVRREA